MKEVYKYRNVKETRHLWNHDNVIALICLNLLAGLAFVYIVLIQSSNMLLGTWNLPHKRFNIKLSLWIRALKNGQVLI